MMTRRPNPARITAALDGAGLHGLHVDEALGGHEPMVDQWETGELIPTPAQIDALADLTGVLPSFFYAPTATPLGMVFMCTRSGRGKGCTVIDTRPDADIVPLHPETLW